MQVGRPPQREALTIFLMRLREQGWDVGPTVARLQACGAGLQEQVIGEAPWD
jgi:hypothetical protein